MGYLSMAQYEDEVITEVWKQSELLKFLKYTSLIGARSSVFLKKRANFFQPLFLWIPHHLGPHRQGEKGS